MQNVLYIERRRSEPAPSVDPAVERGDSAGAGSEPDVTGNLCGCRRQASAAGQTILPPLLVALGSGGSVFATRNAGYSHFNALQIQFQRRMSHGLQALVSYNLASQAISVPMTRAALRARA